MPSGQYVRKPTPLQQQCWDALHAHQSVKVAAAAIGMDQRNFRDSCEGYMRRAGIPGPMPFVKVYRTAGSVDVEVGRLRAQVAGLEQQLDAQTAANTALQARVVELELLAHPWIAVHAKLDRILARPAGAPVVTHRRQADGGAGGKRERRGEVAA
jgi:hypothetical protein